MVLRRGVVGTVVRGGGEGEEGQKGGVWRMGIDF